jgi:UDP-N-acetyl-D-mannosaminuronic acid dehydrogenase
MRTVEGRPGAPKPLLSNSSRWTRFLKLFPAARNGADTFEGPLTKTYDVAIIGGFGHVGLPLAVSLAFRGKNVYALDVDPVRQASLSAGQMPFKEDGCEPRLREALRSEHLEFGLDPRCVSRADVVVIVVGTPVDRHLNPEFEPMQAMLESYLPYFTEGQLIVLRSTVYPGTTDQLRRWLEEREIRVELAFCPERIAEGKAMEEHETLPQIVSAYSDAGRRRCRELFEPLGCDVVELTPIEAELAKLFSNVWRYTLFATANQFFMIANDHGADFYRIHHAMTYKYPRLAGMPRPGFAAGPCLFKDAMQLAAFNNNRFYLGHAAMLVNEGLPNYLVDRLKARMDLSKLTIGVLGMTFKADSDDRRDSLAFKLRKILRFESRRVLCSDVYLDEPDFVPTARLVNESDVIILATPHREYRELKISQDKVVVDIWNAWGAGCLI